jgi:predicted ATPase
MTWCVLTGGPCTGKTTIINELALRGISTVPEAARICITEQMKYGASVSDIFSDLAKLERSIVALQKKHEAEVSTSVPTFFDRGMHDVIAYMREAEVPVIPEALAESRHQHYGKVFVLDPLLYHTDAIRVEDPEKAARIHAALIAVYTEYGMTPLLIPAMPISERVSFILSHSQL